MAPVSPYPCLCGFHRGLFLVIHCGDVGECECLHSETCLSDQPYISLKIRRSSWSPFRLSGVCFHLHLKAFNIARFQSGKRVRESERESERELECEREREST